MGDKTKLGDRIKGYEYIPRTKLMRRQPVIIRLDGKAFHTFTKGMKIPFDDILSKTMEDTMKFLCKNIQGCVLGYTQSDEITLVLIDYKTNESQAWFDYNIQKMCSISASMATLSFNNSFEENLIKAINNVENKDEKQKAYLNKMESKLNKAMFDSRVFSIPQHEVVNCLLWRQQDATRNSIQSVGQANFSQKQLHRKNVDEIQDMLLLERGINWNNFDTKYKRGTCCIKKEYVINKGTEKEAIRNGWFIDYNIPIFTTDREYINKLIYIDKK